MMTRQERILEYFRNPNEENTPERYLQCTQRSSYLVRVIEKLFPDKTVPILELGSGVGRNLHFLRDAGYSNISGIEQSLCYLEAMNQHYPELTGRVLDGLIEDVLPKMRKRFTLTYTMAVLEHIPLGSVFDEIPKITRFLLTIEDEHCDSWNHFPRNYKKFFESRNSMKQVKAWNFPPLSRNFVMRLFENWRNEECIAQNSTDKANKMKTQLQYEKNSCS